MAEDFSGEGQDNVKTSKERAEAARRRSAARHIEGLQRELRGYEMHDQKDRAAAVRAELKRLGAEAPDEPDVDSSPKRTATTGGGRTKR